MRRAVIVQGLGFGDEGKGATIDYLARQLSADLVVRYCGGSQAGHNVVLPDLRSHTFSQFGAGALAGAATFLGEQMIIHPLAMHREAEHLRELTGDDPFRALVIHSNTLVTTLYHQELNRLRELSRGAHRHGSCGHGIGETRRYWLEHGRDAVFASDLHDFALLEAKLELLRQRALIDAQDFIDAVPADESFRMSVFMEPTARAARELIKLGRPLNISATPPSFQTVLFEGAQGVLLDEWRGFHPHTTWSTVTLRHALALVEQIGVEELCTLGVTRAYLTRHGAGPLPTIDPALNATIADPNNPTNLWQGTMRFGWLDLVLLRYAAEAVDGQLDGLVVNNLDQVPSRDARLCTAYRSLAVAVLRKLPVAPLPSLRAQEQLTALVSKATPIFETVSSAALCDRAATEIAPLAITSHGHSWRDRVLHDLRFRSIAAAASPFALQSSI